METLPSDEAQARIAPRSWGAQATELTGEESERIKVVVGENDTYRKQCATYAP